MDTLLPEQRRQIGDFTVVVVGDEEPIAGLRQ